MSLDITHRMVSDEGSMRDIYHASETMLTACPVRTLQNVGSLDVAKATLLVIATMQGEGRDDMAYAIEKPHKFPEYWVPALAVSGYLYDNYGNRIYNAGFGKDMAWDFDISEDYLTFTLVKHEDEEGE